METKNIPVLILLLFTASALCAQDGGYYLDTSGDAPRFFQRLFWYEDEYALSYEVLIQKYNVRAHRWYNETLQKTTTENFLVVSLSPGKYRYRVIPYDLFGRPAEESEWRDFEITPGLFPSIKEIYPTTFFLDQRRQERILYITGKNISLESEVYLRSDHGSIYPIKIEVSGRGELKLSFDDYSLIPGVYEVYVKNPGGLETSHIFAVSYKKPLDLFFKTLWSPVVPLYGAMNQALDMDFYPAGATLSFEAISSKRSDLNGGLEINAAGFAVNRVLTFKKNIDDIFDSLRYADTGAAWMEVNLNIVMQKRFLQGRLAASLRFGSGATFMSASGDYETDMSPLFQGNVGLSAMYLLNEILYIEAGMDFTHVFSTEPQGLLKPRLGLGWQF